MASATWVLPSLDPEWRRACLASMADPIHVRTLVVDNSRTNRGVAASWNLGAGTMRAQGHEWLVIVSEAIRFGLAGGLDLEAALDDDPGYPWVDALFGWHLIAFRASTIEAVGRFDEVFWPAYMEDTDYLYRMGLAGIASPRENDRPRRQLTHIDAVDAGTEHGLRTGRVRVDFGEQARRYRQKWGGDQGHETYRTPYGDPTLTWRDT
ncbi:MAG: glycosyltransferase family 2 protein [Acidimicrobiales bacterium]